MHIFESSIDPVTEILCNIHPTGILPHHVPVAVVPRSVILIYNKNLNLYAHCV